jgi:ABC-type multidrug transport system fused ATPase/permease subunit
MAAATPALDAESESERKQSDALSAKVNSLSTPSLDCETKQSDALPPSFNPLDTRDSHWTLENHLKAYLQRTTESSIASVKPSVLWQDVSVTGSGVIATYQETVTGTFTGPGQAISHLFTRTKKPNSNKTIIHGFEGLVKNGEMLLVLGRPGSGCTTLLKALAGLTDEYTGWQGSIEYNGVPIDYMRKRFRGEVVYSPEGRLPT